jgi:murein hydrolase activator
LITLNKRISIREELIGTMSEEINLLEKKAADQRQQLAQQENDLKSLKAEYARMIYFAYKNQSAYNRLMFLFSSKDFNQAYSRLKYLQQYSSYRKKQGEMIVETEKKISGTIVQLQDQKNEKLGVVKEKEGEIGTLSSEKSEKEQMLVKLQDDEKQLKKEIKKKQEEAQKLQNAIQNIIEEEMHKAREEERKAALAAAEKAKNAKPVTAKDLKDHKTGSAKSNAKDKEENKTASVSVYLTPEAEKLSNSFETNKSHLPWPVNEGVVVSGFGEHEHPVLKNIKIRNNGLDIQTTRNSMARSVFEGEVSGVVSIPGLGNAIIVRHGEYRTVYAHLGEVFVKKGDKVKTKQNIGQVEIDEDSGKTKVHFELWKGTVMLNPELWIAR